MVSLGSQPEDDLTAAPKAEEGEEVEKRKPASDGDVAKLLVPPRVELEALGRHAAANLLERCDEVLDGDVPHLLGIHASNLLWIQLSDWPQCGVLGKCSQVTPRVATG